MTAEVYPDDYFGSLEHNIKGEEHQKRWLVNEIVKPQLPNIIDNIEKCVSLLLSDSTFKMPMSNGVGNDSQPVVRGILSRRRNKIVEFQALVKFPQFHRGKPMMYRMKGEHGHLNLVQIDIICSSLNEIIEILDELQCLEDMDKFTKQFGVMLSKLTTAIKVLDNPPRQLLFPEDNNEVVKTMFEDPLALCESTHHIISVELVLFKNEIIIEFRNLYKVTKRPWCQVDEHTGVSFVDRLRNQLKNCHNVPLKAVMEQAGLQIEEPSMMNTLISRLNTNGERVTITDAQEFLNRCITFDGRVVMECEKVSISTSDPSLISVSSKLNSLANHLSTYYTNLQVV